ncbi:nucleotide-diphospho-sugar transferase [Cladorrhinum samala]|uniref:Nucleotide-diphospho-sugar transferase n=1 Tax=Cladorrhinum samala TaxID=585594 RepID=A0AAV9HFU5_9PEZI|nr:nucleotide-diphospho-sugar transferase [Cladorrhinum samala]
MAQIPKMQPSFYEVIQSRRLRPGALFAFVFLVILYTTVHHQDNIISAGGVPPTTPTTTTTTTDRPIASPLPGDVSVQHHHDGADWSRFAYIQYVTNAHYLCNAVMMFESLHRLGSKADRVMLHPSDMSADDNQLLRKARDEYRVKLVPIIVHSKPTADTTWAESFTKLLAFNQTDYDRVLHLDSDAVLLQPMDELFLLPPCPVAMPRAYWLYPDVQILSSQLMLVQPSAAEFQRVMDRTSAGGADDYDMEIVNYLYKDSAMVLPHRPYDLLTRTFWEEKTRAKYLGNDWEEWDPVAAYNEAKFLHFSDWPVPKPWIQTAAADRTREETQPACVEGVNGKPENCAGRDLWNGFYEEFRTRRQHICESGNKYHSRSI